MTLEEQVDLFDRRAEVAYARCLRSFKERRGEIVAVARERLVAGFETYGDAGFSYSHDRLHREELEEYADAVVYRLMKMSQGWPT